MTKTLLVAAAVALFAAGNVYAQSGADVAKAKCVNCHDIDKKKVASSFKDIAAKHKDNKAAETALVEKLKEGKGHMKVAASEAELKAAVQYALSQK